MNKTILNVILTFLLFSCTDINQSENTIAKLENLRAENDSLRNIVNEINTKYVFDSISIRDIPNYKNTYKLNSEVEGEIVFVGFNINKKTNVILVDSVTYNPKILHNPDTLNLYKGGFQYKKKIDTDRIFMDFVLETTNEFGQEFRGNSRVGIVAKKN